MVFGFEARTGGVTLSGNRSAFKIAVRPLAVALKVIVVFIGSLVLLDSCTGMFHGGMVMCVGSVGLARVSYDVFVSFPDGPPEEFSILLPVPVLEGKVLLDGNETTPDIRVPLPLVQNEKGWFVEITEAHLNDFGCVGFTLVEPTGTTAVRKEWLREAVDLSAGEVRDGRPHYWVYVGAPQGVRTLSVSAHVLSAVRESISVVRLDASKLDQGWYLIEGKVFP